MKKFECKHCELHCVLTSKTTYLLPKFCPFAGGFEPVWHEVKDEVSKHEHIAKVKLPEWCKVGEWIYDRPVKEYRQIKRNDAPYITQLLDAVKNGIVAPARKREFNDKEMKALVGKVLENHKYLLWIEGYDKDTKRIVTLLNSFTAEELMGSDYLIDRAPCYVLEYLNEKGEWVE